MSTPATMLLIPAHGKIKIDKDQKVTPSINNIGIAAMAQFLPLFLSHNDSSKRVRAAKSWLEVPKIVQKIFQAGTVFPDASMALRLTQKKGIPRLIDVAITLPANPFQPASS